MFFAGVLSTWLPSLALHLGLQIGWIGEYLLELCLTLTLVIGKKIRPRGIQKFFWLFSGRIYSQHFLPIVDFFDRCATSAAIFSFWAFFDFLLRLNLFILRKLWAEVATLQLKTNIYDKILNIGHFL